MPDLSETPTVQELADTVRSFAKQATVVSRPKALALLDSIEAALAALQARAEQALTSGQARLLLHALRNCDVPAGEDGVFRIQEAWALTAKLERIAASEETQP